MKVQCIPCGPAANKSELDAIHHLQHSLKSTPGNDDWGLLTNLPFSLSNQLPSDEIDIVAIGPPGVVVIEIKHWDTRWVHTHRDLVEHEAEKLNAKARRIGTTLRKTFRPLRYVSGRFLVTQTGTSVKSLIGTTIRSARFHALREWKPLIDFDSPAQLDKQTIRALARALEPKVRVTLDGDLRRFGSLVNLERQSPAEDRFHRVYSGRRSTSQDRVILHLFDLSAYEGKGPREAASREFETLRRLQQFHWAPRILDSFQDAPAYPGEMCFYSVVDPCAPSVKDRRADSAWGIPERVAFSKQALEALLEFHSSGDDFALVHRNLTPSTLLVRHDGTPVLAGFQIVLKRRSSWPKDLLRQ